MASNDDERLRVGLTRDSIDEENIRGFLSHPEAGGICVFSGTTRGITSGVRTSTLSYDCYEEMAVKEMSKLAEASIEKYGLFRVAIVHRLGEVLPMEASVVIGTSAVHRKEAFEATRYLIDKLKSQVPIWKKEYFDDGSSEWVGVPQGGSTS